MNKLKKNIMDSRLDFYNNFNQHLSKLSLDDTLLIISHNKKEGDLFFKFVGDWEIISMIMSDEEFVNHNKDSHKELEDIRKLILNTAVNICSKNSEYFELVTNLLNKIENKLIVRADKNGYVNCPFCEKKHKHGKGGGNGNRVPDCTAKIINNPVNGKYYKKDGYYVIFN